MADLPAPTVLNQLLAVLREALEGPAQRWSYFTDTSPDAGLVGTLTPLTGAAASRAVAGTSVAAHVHHATWAMDATSAWIRGDRSVRNWADSWTVTGVDEAAWTRLKEDLQRRYQNLRQAIGTHALSGEEAWGGAVAALAHLAYHLGAIRQKIAVLRTRGVV